ncbi:hypothetical protein midi_00532 [Candidatus Midichloria mitochondrii IricVA]|uniref:Uncharacterized protein n=1 Tax=Midichloria mitochondrii (strain IricVA) TaxID=696127 RepID=F7XVY8_MIDMI|nr:hypothetical protein midi_00532 [Candidatus Midichloria mitochondrii IricVA]
MAPNFSIFEKISSVGPKNSITIRLVFASFSITLATRLPPHQRILYS